MQTPKNTRRKQPHENSTELDNRSTEPLDRGGRLHLDRPIAETQDIVRDQYLNDDGEPVSTEQAVSEYFYKRSGERESINSDNRVQRGLRWRDRKNYAYGCELDRQLSDKYDTISTSLISLRVHREATGRVELLHELRQAFDTMLDDKLRYALDSSVESWQFVAVFAGTDQYATPHVHLYIIAEGSVSIKTFRPSVERWIQECEYAPSSGQGNHPGAGTVRIMTGSDTIPRTDDGVSAGMLYCLTQLAHLPRCGSIKQDDALWGSTVRAWSEGSHFRSSQYQVWDNNDANKQTADGSSFSLRQQCNQEPSFRFEEYADSLDSDFTLSRYDFSH